MSTLQQLAQEFIAVFEALAEAFGRAAALLDSRVQAARKRYVEARA
jgi:hypothetical protein